MGWLRGLVGVFLLVMVLGGISFVAYQAGAHNAGDGVSAVTVAGGAAAGESGVVIVRDRGWGGGYHPFGFFGFLFFGIVLLVLLKALFFGAFFREPRGGGPGGWGERARERHDEWHRSSGGPSAGAPGTDAGTAR